MFDSGVKAKSLIDSIKFEADIALPIASSTYLEWLSALEQLIYSEIIREQKAVTLNGTHDIPIDLSEIQPGEFEAPVRYEDIYTVYADEEQLIQSTVTSGVIFRDTWYKTENNLGLNLSKTPETIKIIYFVRPAIKKGSGEEIPDIPVFVPFEFLDMVRAKLLGEAYKMANEDGLAAKWINEYNVIMQTFQAWSVNHKANFGM